MIEYLQIAFRGTTIKRALKYTLFVGAILVTINHGDAILAQAIDSDRALRIALTITVPYIGSTIATVALVRAMRRNKLVT